jgi:hypothetical protein
MSSKMVSMDVAEFAERKGRAVGKRPIVPDFLEGVISRAAKARAADALRQKRIGKSVPVMQSKP